MRLTARVVVQLVQKRAMIKAMTKEEEELCSDIKDRMIEKGMDEFAPPSSPYKLIKLEYPETAVQWKDVAEKAYKELYGTKWKKELDKVVQSYGTKHVCSLKSAPNENYAELAKAS